ncbi:MAG: ABC transporter substrate-binding protein, partial [Candidatus Rokuibacteriota bacterium]
LSRPDGNLTGLEIVTTQLDAKRLEILKEALPTITTVALLWNPGAAAYNASNLADQRRGMEAAAQALGVRLGMLEARDLRQIDTVFRTIQREDPGALLVGSDAIFTSGRQRIVELATQLRIPSMYGWREFVEVGGFMSYGTSLPDLYRRAAIYVDKILKGAKPADLPVEQPSKFELVINLKTAKELGLKIPPPVLGRADQVIE